jgi:hypothetical protein
MTTFAADQESDRLLQELDERTREAWQEYRGSLSDLSGAEYEETETHSWERLQHALQELADERDLLAPPPQQTAAS